MGAEVIDTNVLFVATSAHGGARVPDVPTDDPAVLHRVVEWLVAFRADPDRRLVIDFPERTILLEYQGKLRPEHFGRQVVQHKIDTGA